MAHIIMGMPPQDIIIGIPARIIAIMRSQHWVIISIDMPSIGFISQVMPVGVMVQVIMHIIIGIMPPIIGIIPPIIGFIMGIMGIMPPIIGFIIGIGMGIIAGIAVMVGLLVQRRAFCAIHGGGLIPHAVPGNSYLGRCALSSAALARLVRSPDGMLAMADGHPL